MKNFLRVFVWPAACGFAVLASGCTSDNESAANIKGDAPSGGSSAYLNQSKGGVSDAQKSYPGAAKGQAKAVAADKAADKGAAPAK